ncbi:hypothetical protein FH972_015534 [Carpinus fangiana]|uniref:Uncharacterized protein n=1 Tax=Carpinus fangiana TaxID=176857 RepID=A0A5N6RD12_9ROSI|nr:hypothetical protein FH972_015534 [Carpinus fangiana]
MEEKSLEEAVKRPVNAGETLVIQKSKEDIFSYISPAGFERSSEVGWSGEEKVISPNFKGPLFSDLEKQLQVSKLGSGGKNSGPSKKEFSVVAWKRIACGDVEKPNDTGHTVKQGGGKNMNSVEKQNKWVQLKRDRS